MVKITYKQVEGFMEEMPLEIDTMSSKDVVYLRKNIKKVPNKDNIDGKIVETKGTHWLCEEAILTRKEYEIYKEDLVLEMQESIKASNELIGILLGEEEE